MIFKVLCRIAGCLRDMSPKCRFLMAFALGLLSVLALPPLHLVPVLLISFPFFFWLLDGVNSRRGAFILGWGFGWGHWIGGLYWIGNALLMDVARFGWMIPFAIGGLAALLAVYSGIIALVSFSWAPRGTGRIFVFAGAWTIMEFLRGILLTGFSWSPMGHVWAVSESMIQSAAWIGVYGLSLVTVLTVSLPAVLGWHGVKGGVPALFGFAGLVVLGVGGAMRLPSGAVPVVEGVRLRLVQPAIPQAIKWDSGESVMNLRRYMELSDRKGDGSSPTHVIWGETAVPFLLNGSSDLELREMLGSTVASFAERSHDAILLTGVVRATPEDQPFQMWNSLVALDKEGDIRALYDKTHLVPFGEYVPFGDILPLRKVTAGGRDLTAGLGLRTIAVPGLPPMGPLICYEVIFPGDVVERVNRPQWLLNVTNDGWYGISAGPYQHLTSAVFRAVEEGLPLIRVANTGISAVIDPYGRIIGRIGLGQEGYLDSDLPQALPRLTLFARFGNAISLSLAVIVLFVGMGIGRREKH